MNNNYNELDLFSRLSGAEIINRDNVMDKWQKAMFNYNLKNSYKIDKEAKKKITIPSLKVMVIFGETTSPRVGLPRKYKRRSTTTKPRLHDTKRVSLGAILNNNFDKNKLKNLIGINDFINKIGEYFHFQEQKEKEKKRTPISKYQLFTFDNVKLCFRLSNHNINCNNIQEELEETISVVLKSKKSKNN